MGLRFLEIIHKKIDKNAKISFIATIIIGCIAHLYKFTNNLPHFDTLNNFYSDQNVIGSGRWFLSIACAMSSFFDLPWIDGVFSLIFIACTVMLLVKILEVENPIIIVLMSGITVTFPGITETFFYEYTADGYMLAMLMVTMAAYISIKKSGIMSWMIPVILIACTCGTYQAYISYGILLIIVYYLLKILENKENKSQIYKEIVKQIIIYIVGLLSYVILWKVLLILENTKPSRYQGIDSMQVSVSGIIHGLKHAWNDMGNLFWEDNPATGKITTYTVLNIVFVCVIIVVICESIVKTKIYKNFFDFCIYLLGWSAIPNVIFMWNFVSETVIYRPMMIQSMTIFVIFIIILSERYFRGIVRECIAILIFCMIVNNTVVANICYYYFNRSFISSCATTSEIISRIHMVNSESKKIYIVGSHMPYDMDDSNIGQIFVLSDWITKDLVSTEDYFIKFAREYFYENYESADISNFRKGENYRIIKEMDVWPADGSVKVIDDVVVIKFR